VTRTEIINEVVSLTDREDLAATSIPTMVTAATLRMHQSDFYSRDLAEDMLDLGTEGFHFSFDASTTFPRFRALHYLRKYDLTGETAGVMLSHLDPLSLFDSYGVEKNDVWYNAGKNINIRSASSLRYLLAGWYQNPDTSATGYSSWIADMVPHAIIFDAASLVFNMIAQQEQSRKFDSLVAEQLVLVRMHGFDARGY